MSFELLLILTVLVLLPLLQVLLPAARRPSGPAQQPVSARRDTMSDVLLRVHPPKPNASVVLQSQAKAHREVSEAMTHQEAARTQSTAWSLASVPAIRSSARQITTAFGLRRAIVLMTLIGPCRAVDPPN